MPETRYRRNFSLDREIYFELRDLAKKYHINLSRLVDDAFLEVLTVLREIDNMVQETPNGVPKHVARSYLEKIMLESNQKNSLLLERYFPDEITEKTKAQ